MADEPEEKGKPEEGADPTDWKAMTRKWEQRFYGGTKLSPRST